jgi:hypothetical protein
VSLCVAKDNEVYKYIHERTKCRRAPVEDLRTVLDVADDDRLASGGDGVHICRSLTCSELVVVSMRVAVVCVCLNECG